MDRIDYRKLTGLQFMMLDQDDILEEAEFTEGITEDDYDLLQQVSMDEFTQTVTREDIDFDWDNHAFIEMLHQQMNRAKQQVIRAVLAQARAGNVEMTEDH